MFNLFTCYSHNFVYKINTVPVVQVRTADTVPPLATKITKPPNDK